MRPLVAPALGGGPLVGLPEGLFAGLPAGLFAGLMAAAAAAMLGPAVPRARSARPSWGALVAGAGGCLGVVLALSPPVGGLAAPVVVGPVLVGLLALGVRWLVLARRRLVTVRDTASRVRECCESLAEELAAGSGPDRALARAARDWPPLGPVLAAHRVGLDVPGAWRVAASAPGAGGLRLVGAAWQVSGRTGQGLAAALARVAEDLRATEASRRVVASELASARATGRLVAGLPVLAWLMGSGSGGDPLAWLLGGPAGWACLALGGGLLLGGLAWIELLARSVER